MSTAEEARTTTGLNLEIKIAASTAVVWRALTEGIGDWWPNEFFIGGQEGKRKYILEAKPGGRMVEEWDDGGGLLWGQVTTVMPEEMLQITSHTFPQWGGPSITFGTWRLTATDEGTTLSLDEHTLGKVPEDHAEQKTVGWTFLLDLMKAHIEGTPAPKWEE